MKREVARLLSEERALRAEANQTVNRFHAWQSELDQEESDVERDGVAHDGASDRKLKNNVFDMELLNQLVREMITQLLRNVPDDVAKREATYTYMEIEHPHVGKEEGTRLREAIINVLDSRIIRK